MHDRFRTLAEDKFDAVIIGAGAGGLTAGALLAKRGRKVLIVDQHYVPGGNMSSFKRAHYEFDVGLHYVGACHETGLLRRVLDAAGASNIEFEPMDPTGFDTLVLPGITFSYPRGLQALEARLLQAFPAERQGIGRYMGLLHHLHRLQLSLGRPLAALAALPSSVALLRWSQRSLAELLDHCTGNAQLRAVLAGQHLDYALPPSKVSAMMGLLLTLHLVEAGGFYPRGGGQAVANALADNIEERGGRVLLRTRATRIVVERGRVQAVEIENKHIGRRVIRTPLIVSNADLKRTLLEHVGSEHLSKRAAHRIREYEMAPALGSVYLGIARDLRAENHPARNYWVQSSLDLEHEYQSIARGITLEEPSIIISIASLKDPTNSRLAPRGVTNLQVIGLAPSQPEAWGVEKSAMQTGQYRSGRAYRERKRQYAEKLIRAAERVFPDLSKQIVYEEVGTPLTHQRYTLSTSGTSYGIASTPAQSLLRRPQSRTPIAGLYLCGASCRTAHGIAGAALSGLFAVASIDGSGVIRDAMSGRATLPAAVQELTAAMSERA